MRRAIVVPLFVLSVLAAVPSSAAATPTNGNFGFGGKLTLGGVAGLDALYWFGDFAIEGVMGFRYFTNEDPFDDSFLLGVAFGGFYKVADSPDSHFAFGGRFDILAAENGGGTMTIDNDDVEFGIELLTRAEHYFDEHFALNFEVGIGMLFGDDVRFTLGETWLVAGAGFNYYFGGASTAAPAPATTTTTP